MAELLGRVERIASNSGGQQQISGQVKSNSVLKLIVFSKNLGRSRRTCGCSSNSRYKSSD